MYLDRIKLRDDVFIKLLDLKKTAIEYIDDIVAYCNKGVKLDKRKLYYSEKDNAFIVKKGYIYVVANMPFKDDGYKMVMCISSKINSDIVYKETPYAVTCVKYMKKIFLKYYTEEEYEECLNSHTVDEHIIPIHINPPYYYRANRIYKLDQCVYYDMNNAHLDALCEIFPKAKKDLIALRERINKYKAEKNYEEAQHLKDIVNIYVGELGNNEHPKYKKTNEWIVNRTKNMLQALIDQVKGTVIYANTDGVIIRYPENPITTSNKLGEFKNELKDDIVYLLVHVGKTVYTIYQYNDHEIKGSALNAVRDKIDLSKGVYVDYKRTKTLGGWIPTDLEILEGEVYG